ncbi:transporter [Burkholderia sp. R-70006]|nr:transporter [Burkholderia sp. R-70006]
MVRIKPVVALILASFACTQGVHATENGTDTIGEGAEGFFAGALPPQGLYGLAYYSHYEANRFNDADGHAAIPGFHLDANVLIGRVVYMSGQTFLGGRVGAYAVLPVEIVSLDAAGAAFNHTGIGDAAVAPLLLAWGAGSLRTAGALEISVPTGQYDPNSALNLGHNYYSFRPVFTVTWLPTSALEFSGKVTYTFNTSNPATDYHSGQLFHIDYSESYAVTPKLRVGVNGYYVQQTTDDRQDGQSVDGDGFRGRVIGVGPAVRYQFAKCSVEARWVKEFEVRNRPDGNALWIKAEFAF